MNFRALLRKFLSPVPVLPPSAAYDLWAPTYDERTNNAVLFLEEQAVLPLLDGVPLSGKNAIDFGSGTGRHISHLLARGARTVAGVDLSGPMLKQALPKFTTHDVLLIQSRMEQLPFQDSMFDFGIVSFVLSHVQTLDRSIREIARVLKPEASLIVADVHPEFGTRGWDRTFRPAGTGTTFAVESYYHARSAFEDAFKRNQLLQELVLEPPIDLSLRPMFDRTKTLPVFDRYFGKPLILVFRLRKQ